MAQKQYPIINNFSKGELSSRMEGRVDIQGYYNGCKIMENCIMVAQGGVEKRPGTIYLGEIYDMDTESKLIPFEVSDTEIYILEVGDHATRVWDVQTKTLIQDSGSDLIIETPFSSKDVSSIQYATTEGTIFFAHQNYPFITINKKDDGFTMETFEYKIGDWVAKVYTKGQRVFNDGEYYEAIKTTDSVAPVVGTWGRGQFIGGAVSPSGNISEYDGANFSAGDVYTYNGNIYKALRTYSDSGAGVCWPGKEIEEYAWSGWSSSETAFVGYYSRRCSTSFLGVCLSYESYVSYLDREYITPTQKIQYGSSIAVALIGAWVDYKLSTLESSSSISTNPYWGPPTPIPGGTDVSIVKEWTAGSYDKNEVVYLPSTYVMYVCLGDGTTATPGTAPMWESLSNNPFFAIPGDYPASVAFLSQRLYLGGTLSHPQTIFGSKIDDFHNFDIGLDDDDAFSFTIATDRSSRIKWMAGKDNLIVGTTSSEWLITGEGGRITPTNIQVLKQSAYGSAYNQAIQVADTLLFYQKGGRKLREYMYSNNNKAYLANDLTFFADHITSPGIDESTYQQNPDSILWNTKTNGGLVGLTYDRLNQIAGWHRHNTDGVFESVVAIDGHEEEDELWFVTRRQINGVFKRFVEHMAPRLTNIDLVYSDASIIISNGATFSITSITNNITSVEVAYLGSTGLAEGDNIKIYGTNNDTYDYIVFQVKDLNQGTDDGVFNLEQDSSYFTTTDISVISNGGFSRVEIVITGLDYLLGKTVNVLGDKAPLASQEVVSNIDGLGGIGIILETYCNIVVCGLSYEMVLQPESIELPGASTLGATKRVSGVTLKLYNSLGGFVGSNRENLEEIQYRTTDIPLGAAIPLYTGTKYINIDAESNKESGILVTNNQPLPMTVLAIITDITYSRS